MSVVYVKETFENRSADARQDGHLYTYQYQRMFKVQFDNMYEGTYFALSASHGGVTIPRLGDPFSDGHPTEPQYDYTARAVHVGARPDKEDPFAQIVIASYSSSWGSGEAGGGQIYPNPVDPWPQNQWEWGTITSVEPVVATDFDDPPKAFLSSAGEPFDPSPTAESRDPVLTITRGAFADASVADIGAHIREYKDSVNSADFCGYLANHAWMANITGRTAFRSNTWYWLMRYEIRFSPQKPWTPRRLLDQGIYELEGEPPEMVHMQDAQGNLLVEPALLDGEGHRLPRGSPAVYLPFTWHEPKDWASLKLLAMPGG